MNALLLIRLILIVLPVGLISCGTDTETNPERNEEVMTAISSVVVRGNRSYSTRNSFVEKLEINDMIQFVELPNETKPARAINKIEANYSCYPSINEEGSRTSDPIIGKVTVPGQSIQMSDIVSEDIIMKHPGSAKVVECDIAVKGISKNGSTLKGLDQTLLFDTSESAGLNLAINESTLDTNQTVVNFKNRPLVRVEGYKYSGRSELKCAGFTGDVLDLENNLPLPINKLIEDPIAHHPDLRISETVQVCRVFEYSKTSNRKQWTGWFRLEFYTPAMTVTYSPESSPLYRKSTHSRLLVGTVEIHNSDATNSRHVAFRHKEMKDAQLRVWGAPNPKLNRNPLEYSRWSNTLARVHLKPILSENKTLESVNLNNGNKIEVVEVPPSSSVRVRLIAENKSNRSCLDFLRDDFFHGYELTLADGQLGVYNYSDSTKSLGSPLINLTPAGKQKSCLINCDFKDFVEMKQTSNILKHQRRSCR